jgi:hypothetical protein
MPTVRVTLTFEEDGQPMLGFPVVNQTSNLESTLYREIPFGQLIVGNDLSQVAGFARSLGTPITVQLNDGLNVSSLQLSGGGLLWLGSSPGLPDIQIVSSQYLTRVAKFEAGFNKSD